MFNTLKKDIKNNYYDPIFTVLTSIKRFKELETNWIRPHPQTRLGHNCTGPDGF
jgi:hypothetical protein